MKPGAKYYEWEARGVPLRLEIGPRDVAGGSAMLARRTGGKKESVARDGIAVRLRDELARMQDELLAAARARRDASTVRNATREEFLARMEGPGGFVFGGFCGSPSCETEVKNATKATIRVLPDPEFQTDPAPARCMWCDGPAVTEAVWAKAY